MLKESKVKSQEKNSNSKFKILSFTLFLGFLLLTFYSLAPVAEAAIVPCNPLKPPPGKTATTACTFGDLGTILVRIYDFMLGIAGVVALYYMVFGAFQMLQGWLSGDPEGMFKKGLKTFKGALWGIFFIATAYVLVKLVLELLGSKYTIDQWVNQIFK